MKCTFSFLSILFNWILFSETEIIFTILHPVGFHAWNTKGIQYKCECCTTLVHKSVWSRLVGFKGETVIFLRAALILNSVALSLAEKDNLVFLVLLGLLDPLPGTVQIYSGMNRCLEKKSYYISLFQPLCWLVVYLKRPQKQDLSLSDPTWTITFKGSSLRYRSTIPPPSLTS